MTGTQEDENYEQTKVSVWFWRIAIHVFDCGVVGVLSSGRLGYEGGYRFRDAVSAFSRIRHRCYER